MRRSECFGYQREIFYFFKQQRKIVIETPTFSLSYNLINHYNFNYLIFYFILSYSNMFRGVHNCIKEVTVGSVRSLFNPVSIASSCRNTKLNII